MFCLLRAEGYKLRRSKSFYVCAAVMTAYAFLMYGVLSMVGSARQEDMGNAADGAVVMMGNAEPEPASVSIWDEIGVMDVMQQMFSGDMSACILAIFASIFVIGEYGSGMVKNVVGKGHPRAAVFLAKLAATVLAAVLMLLAGMASVLLCGRLFIGKEAFTGGFWQKLLVYAGQQMMMAAALTAVFVLIGETVRNLAAGISLGIAAAAIPVLLLQGIDMLCADSGITPSDYWLVTRSAGCPAAGVTAGYIAETALVAAFWFLAAAGLGLWHFYKADIK